MTEQPSSSRSRDATDRITPGGKPSSQHSYHDNVRVQQKLGRLRVADEGLFFLSTDPRSTMNQDDTETRLCRWSQLQTMTANVATSSTAMLKLTTTTDTRMYEASTASNTKMDTRKYAKKILVQFSSRPSLEQARHDIQSGWQAWRHQHNKTSRRHLDQGESKDFSESHRSGEDGAEMRINRRHLEGSTSATHDELSSSRRKVAAVDTKPTNTTDRATKQSHERPSKRSMRNSNVSLTSTVSTNASTIGANQQPMPPVNHHQRQQLRPTQDQSDRPLVQVLPHNRILLPRPAESNGPPGHYVLDFSTFENTQSIDVTVLTNDFREEQQQQHNGPSCNFSLSLDRSATDHVPSTEFLPTGGARKNSTHRSQGEPQYQPDNDVEALQRTKWQIWQASRDLPTNPSHTNQENDVAGYRISKQQCYVIAAFSVGCMCFLLITTLVLVILSVTVWNNDNGGEEGNGGTIWRDDDFYAGFNNNNN